VRVLLVTPYLPERDGIAAYSALIRGELEAQGHDAFVICARAAPPHPPEVLGSLPKRPWGSPRPAISAAAAFAPDVVHVQFAVAAYGTLVPALLRFMDGLRELRLPIVITMHEVTRDTESLRLVGRALYRRLAQRADRVVVHTEAARSAIEARVADHPWAVTVIAHPRSELPHSEVTGDALRARLGLGADRIVLSFGFIDVDKGLSEIIMAAGLLEQRGELDGVKLVIAGEVRRRFGVFRVFELRDRAHLWAVKRKLSKLGLDHRVRFVGFVPTDEIRAWFDLATVAVLAYRRSEQSGVASLAMAAGTPLLTSDVGELATMSSGTPFPPRNSRALASELGRFLRAGAVRPDGGAVGAGLTEIVTQTCTLYRQVNAGGRATRATA
jgi:glycosyltransferase involved in cell wall biosynthesis